RKAVGRGPPRKREGTRKRGRRSLTGDSCRRERYSGCCSGPHCSTTGQWSPCTHTISSGQGAGADGGLGVGRLGVGGLGVGGLGVGGSKASSPSGAYTIRAPGTLRTMPSSADARAASSSELEERLSVSSQARSSRAHRTREPASALAKDRVLAVATTHVRPPQQPHG